MLRKGTIRLAAVCTVALLCSLALTAQQMGALGRDLSDAQMAQLRGGQCYSTNGASLNWYTGIRECAHSFSDDGTVPETDPPQYYCVPLACIYSTVQTAVCPSKTQVAPNCAACYTQVNSGEMRVCK